MVVAREFDPWRMFLSPRWSSRTYSYLDRYRFILLDVCTRGCRISRTGYPHLFVLRRFTNQEDTVATFTADLDGVAEISLFYGRKFEGFVADAGQIDEVEERVEDAFDRAWRMGMFNVS